MLPQATGVDVSPVVGQTFTGDVATFSDGTFTDPTGFTASITWGDGHTSNGTIVFAGSQNQTNINGQTVNVSLFTVTGTNTYTTAGSYPLSVTITDPNTNTATVNPTARVAYAPLVVSDVATINASFGGSFTNQAVATFTDPGLVANLATLGISDPTTQFSATINWGDGSSVVTGNISYNATTHIFSVLGSHTYAQAGSYSISASVTPLTVSVERIDSSDPTSLNEVGDENGNDLTDSPSADFIDQFVIGAAGQTGPLYTFSLPTVATTGGNEALTNSSYSVSEGQLTLSTNGQYLVTGGYNDTVSLWAPQQTFSPGTVINRVIGTISGAGVINTTTDLTDAYNGDNFRGVVSNGTQFWTAGNATDDSSYVHYVATTGATTSTIITGPNSTPYNSSNINTVEIFNGQLYEGVRSVGATAPAGIYQIGTGLPTTAGASGQTQTLFIPVPQSDPLDLTAGSKPMSPFGFYMTNLPSNSNSINGVNVAYVADAEMGIARYDYTGSSWQFSYYIDSTGTFKDSVYTVDSSGNISATASFDTTNPPASVNPNVDSTKAGGVRELTGRIVNGQVQLFAVTGFGDGAQPNPSASVIQVTDIGANSSFTTLATDSGASELTGIAFSPTQIVTSSAKVNAANTSTAVTCTAYPAVFGQPISFTATVTNTSGTGVKPAGMVQFYVDGVAFGSPVSLDATGHATSGADVFWSGASHNIHAIYSPTSNFVGSNGSLAQVIQSIAVETDPANSNLTDLFIGSSGANSNDQVTVNPLGNSSTGSTGIKVQTTLNGVNAQNSYNQSFNSIHVFLQNGNDNVKLAPSLTINAVVSAGNGNDSVQLGNSSDDSVTLGNGNDNVLIGNGSFNTVMLGNGNDGIQFGDGSNNTVILPPLDKGHVKVTFGHGSNNTIK